MMELSSAGTRESDVVALADRSERDALTKDAATRDPRARHQKRIDDIEVLRAVAVIFVLIQHLPLALFPWLGLFGGSSPLYIYFGFWNGVDLFFAVSGFVIARSLLPTLAAAGNTLAYFNAALAFWIRRAWRLLPSAWLWLAIILVASVAFNRSGAFGTYRANFEGAVAAVLEAANFRAAWAFNRFEVGAAFPYWSLSLEEQFYLLLPFVAFWSGRRLPLVLGLLVLVQIFLPRGLGDGAVGLLGWIRSDAILLGVLIAIWSTKQTYRLFEPVFLCNRPWASGAVFLGLVFLLAAVGSPVLHIVPFQVGLVALIAALLVSLASYDRNFFCGRGPLKSLMLWIGSRSYGIYLIHIPAYSLTREIWFNLEPPGTAFTSSFTLRFACTAALLLLLLTELNYRLVESPLRRRGARISERIANRLIPSVQVL